MTLARALQYQKRLNDEIDPEKRKKIQAEWEAEICAGVREAEKAGKPLFYYDVQKNNTH